MRKRFVVLFLIGCGLVESTFAASTTPLLQQKDPQVKREFQNVYQTMGKSPAIFIGPSAPAFTPLKYGDIFISTGTSKVYIATATSTSSSWAVLN